MGWDHRNRKGPIRPRVLVPGLDAWEKLEPDRRAVLEQWMPAIRRHAREYEKRFEMEKGELLVFAFGIACRVAAAWNPGKAAFSTYLFAALGRSLHQWCARHKQSEKARRQSAIPEYSHPVVHDPEPFREPEPPTIEAAMDRVDATEQERAMVRMRMDGATLKQCGAAFGLTTEGARQRLNKLGRQLAEAA